MRARSLALAGLVLLGSGCAVGLVPQSMLPPSSNVHAYVQVGLARPEDARPPNPLPNTIPIYRSTAPDRPYRELGTVYVNNTMDKQAMAAVESRRPLPRLRLSGVVPDLFLIDETIKALRRN